MSRLALLNAVAIPAAGTYTTTPITGIGDVGDITLYANFDWTSGGTSVDAYVQTTIDGTNWIDIANFHFTGADAAKVLSVSASGDLAANPTLTDGSLAADTVLSGLIGDQLRVKYIVVGTYAASTLSLYAETRTDSGGGGGSVSITGTVPVKAQSGALTNRSGTITSGGVAQNAAAALATRVYLFLLNPATETEILWFSTVATAVAASPSIPLYPGQSFEMNGTFCSSGALSVIAATTGHVFISREG